MTEQQALALNAMPDAMVNELLAKATGGTYHEYCSTYSNRELLDDLIKSIIVGGEGQGASTLADTVSELSGGIIENYMWLMVQPTTLARAILWSFDEASCVAWITGVHFDDRERAL